MEVLFDYNFEEAALDLARSRDVGLTIFRDQYVRPSLICLTAEKNIYVIQTDSFSQVKFLVEQLQRDPENLRFYIIDGSLESPLLSKYLGVELVDSEPDCKYVVFSLVTLDMFIQVRRHRALSGASDDKTQSISEHLRSSSQLAQRDYNELIAKYLDKSKQIENLEFKRVLSPPLGPGAWSIIKEVAGPVRELAVRMMEDFNQMKRDFSKRIFSIHTLSDYSRSQFDKGSDMRYAALMDAYKTEQ